MFCSYIILDPADLSDNGYSKDWLLKYQPGDDLYSGRDSLGIIRQLFTKRNVILNISGDLTYIYIYINHRSIYGI